MPIITPGDTGLRERLEAVGVPLVDEATALAQDIRPARIGLMNLMPAAAMEVTETQWLRWIGGQALLQIEPVLVKFDDDRREKTGASRRTVLRRYVPFSEVTEQGLDGLIITGDNLEIQQHVGFSSQDPLEFEDIRYYKQLCEIMDWAEKNTASTIYSCLAAHFALSYRHGLPREIGKEKIFGIYDHDVLKPESAFMRGMDDTLRAPHSRWGNTPVERVLDDRNLTILALSPRVGWLAIERANKAGGTDLLLQGHPEYNRLDLHHEYLRDRAQGRALPEHYYREDVPQEDAVRLTWSTHARLLHENWIGEIYRRISKPTKPTD